MLTLALLAISLALAPGCRTPKRPSVPAGVDLWNGPRATFYRPGEAVAITNLPALPGTVWWLLIDNVELLRCYGLQVRPAK
jgi:hypothetical protein